MPTRVIVSGDRNWRCDDLAKRIVGRLVDRYGDDMVIVHGAAPGGDSAFDVVAIMRRVVREPFPADWGGFGARAGPKRNQAMIDSGAAFLIACHQDIGSSKGTRDCVRRAIEAGIPCFPIDSEDGEPRRITSV